MIYNIKKMKIKNTADCISCPYHNHNTNKCNGFGKCCFPMDDLTGAIKDITSGTILSQSAIKTIHDNLNKENE